MSRISNTGLQDTGGRVAGNLDHKRLPRHLVVGSVEASVFAEYAPPQLGFHTQAAEACSVTKRGSEEPTS